MIEQRAKEMVEIGILLLRDLNLITQKDVIELNKYINERIKKGKKNE